MSSSGIHLGEGVRRGGHPPGSYEARAAIEKVRQAMNPSQPNPYGHAPAWSFEQTERKAPALRSVQCEMCRELFECRSAKARYCKTCYPIRAKQRWDEDNVSRRVVRDAPCAHCGTVVRLEGQNKYCGDPCRDAETNRKQREAYAMKKAGAVPHE